jgi:uncharacterized protein YpuA (DUF1002 family)
MTRQNPDRRLPLVWRRTCSVFVFLAILVVVTLPFATSGSAEDSKTITLGESLNDLQRTELLDFFQAGEDDRIIVVTTADTIDAMAGISMVGTISSAYSSTALECRDLGDGLDVTTRNINQVTPDLYAIALVTAGIGDATLVVAAPSDLSAGGMTALAGIFKTWDLAPCASGNTSPERQQLALEQLALATAIGQSLEFVGIADGQLRAGNVVLETQKTIVTQHLTESTDIDAAIAQQELAQGISIPPDLRVQLIDMLTRLAAQKIDWSTFAAGWTIERSPDNTRVTMTGDGIAIRNARATATAQSAADQTATAQARDNLTATAAADARNATATTQAELDQTATARADATAQARADLTATALAQPTATPAPQSVSGVVVSTGSTSLTIKRADETEATYAFSAEVTVEIDNRAAAPGDLGKGDKVELVVSGSNGQVLQISANAAPKSSLVSKVGAIALFPFAAGAVVAVILSRKRREEPFIVTLANR